MHVGKNKVTATMLVTIRKASNINSDSMSDNRNTVFVKWERASSGVSAKKKKEGTTKRALISNNEAIWEEKLAIKCTFYQSAKTQQWDPKHIYFTLKEDQVTAKGRNKGGDTGTKEKALGKWKIDLAEYVKSDGADPVIFPMTAKKRSSSHKKSSSASSLPMTLNLLFECKWSKFNNKKLVKMDDNDSENYKKEVIQIEGEEYYLEPALVDSDDDEVTETATEPNDEDDDDDSVDFEADDDTPSSSTPSSSSSSSSSYSSAASAPAKTPSSSSKSSGGTVRGDPRLTSGASSNSNSNIPPPLPPKDARYHDTNNNKSDAPKSNRGDNNDSGASIGGRKPQSSGSGSNLAGGYLSMTASSTSSSSSSSSSSAATTVSGLSNDLSERCSQLERLITQKDDRIRQLEDVLTSLQTQLKEKESQGVDNISVSQAKGLKQQYEQLLKDQRMKGDLIAKQEREIEDLRRQLQTHASAPPSSSGTGITSGGALVNSSSPSLSPSPSSSSPSTLQDTAMAIAQDLEEINLVESAIYLKEPSFTERFSSAAVGLYDALVSFKAFDSPPRTRLLTHILRAITVSCKKSENDPNLLCYWLNSISSLLYFFSKANNTSSPALTEFVSGLQIAVPQIFSLLLVHASKDISHKAVPAILEQQPTLFLTKKTFIPRYNVLSIIDVLDGVYVTMEHNFVPRTLREQFFEHLFYSINTVVFNALLKRKNLCSCGHGFQIKLEISVLEEWISNHSLHVARYSQLEHLVEAANLLVMDKKALGDWTALHKAFPILTSQQILQILTSFVPDELNQTVTPPEILHFLSADVTIGDEDSICLWFYPEGPLKIDLSKLFNDFQQ